MIFVHVGEGDPQGPFTPQELSALWKQGDIGSGALYWHRGLPEWRPVEEYRSPSPAQLQVTSKVVLLTTAAAFTGRRVLRDLRIVGAEYAASLNAWKDLLANVRDAVGGRSATLQGALKTAREAAESELASAALSTGAQGVLGVRFEFSHVNTGQGGHMLIVMATGTAVELEPNFPPLPDGE